MAISTLPTLLPSAAVIAIARMKAGKAMTESTQRMIDEIDQAAIDGRRSRRSSEPITSATAVAPNATVRSTRAAWMMRESRSRP